MADAVAIPGSCVNCGLGRKPLGVPEIVFSTLSQVSEGAAQGCVQCSVLFRGIQEYLKTAEPWTGQHIMIEVNFSLIKSLRASLIDVHNTTGYRTLSFYESSRSSWLEKAIPDLPLGMEPPSRTSSDESLEWARKQIDRCGASHKACKDSSTLLPKRVLDVGVTSSDRVSLYEPNSHSAPYVCLSHCWGRRPFLRTLSHNIEAHKDIIQWDLLPPSFQHTIEVTRKLGIRYLWIDSLCIIQDDEDDWRQEASNMASIYQNSFLVISATKSADAYGGLYSELPSDCQSRNVTVRNDNGTLETVHVRRALDHHHQSGGGQEYGQMLLPIFTRGWVFQERFLSARVLYFGPEELAWECLEASACQCIEAEEFNHAAGVFVPGQTNPKQHYSVCSLEVVVSYRLGNNLEATHDDIFPAISGLAKEFQGEIKSDYCAGLWKTDLLDGLLWTPVFPPLQTDGPHEPLDEAVQRWSEEASHWVTPRPTSWRAPSWSWASVKMPVEFMDVEFRHSKRVTPDPMKPLCHVLAISCQHIGADPTGELATGKSHIVLQGRLAPASICSACQRNVAVIRPDDNYENILNPLLRPGVWSSQFTNNQDAPSADLEGGGTDTCPSTETKAGDGTVVPFLFMVGKVGSPENPTVFLMLLPEGEEQRRPDSGRVPNLVDSCVYRRIGLLIVIGNPLAWCGQDWIAKVMDVAQETEVKIV
ncbi:heterokaryon incompatibility protein-domain-containing protein [Podospora aff. communis PSN243]|uniref:Heterokaryon incompatibility protein-domain-containing protein n=1 Tax=Podospora aff. communis PSN243 TaxID=3040156 RepID=A0AAV9GL78_9PEZI|nr:heterokaryon incompatibility protein-domain-containing protein [Podospora aff. communis PSN243]